MARDILHIRLVQEQIINDFKKIVKLFFIIHYITPRKALEEGCKESKGHNDVIIGKGNQSDLKVMGVAIEKGHSFV